MKTTGRPVIVFYPNKKLIKVYHSEMDPGLKRQLRCEFDSTPVRRQPNMRELLRHFSV